MFTADSHRSFPEPAESSVHLTVLFMVYFPRIRWSHNVSSVHNLTISIKLLTCTLFNSLLCMPNFAKYVTLRERYVTLRLLIFYLIHKVLLVLGPMVKIVVHSLSHKYRA